MARPPGILWRILSGLAAALLAAGVAWLIGGGWRVGLAAGVGVAVGWLARERRLHRLARSLQTAQRDRDQQRDRFEREMALAAEVHDSLIPPSVHLGPFHIDIRYLPLERIGGDMVGLHVDGDGRVARIGVGDVTGHGTAAALLVNRIHHETEDLLRLGLPLEEIVCRINRLVWRTFSGTEMLMTFAAVEVDAGARRVRWVNGGHPPPLLWHAATGSISLLTPQATLLGMSEDLLIDPPAQALALGPGDRLILHTDGLIDALDTAGRRFGMDRLIAAAGEILAAGAGPGGQARAPEAAAPPPSRIGAEIVQRVRRYAGRPLQDDVLVVTVAVDVT